MDPATHQLLQKLGSAFGEAVGSVFSMLTGREFVVTPGSEASLSASEVAHLHERPVAVKAAYAKGVTGAMVFLLPLTQSTQLVDLMLGGEGAASEELSGDSRDALAETFNQILGSANQTLSDQVGETLSISGVEILFLEGEEGVAALLGEGSFEGLKLTIAQDQLSADLHLLAPGMLAEQLRRKLGLGLPSNEPEAEPQTTPLAAPAPAANPMRGASVDTGNLDLLLDIELPVMVRMGHAEMPLGELLKLTPGSILELNRAADSPVDLLVNGKQIAKGEVVVVDGNFAFRILEIESTDTRIRSLS